MMAKKGSIQRDQNSYESLRERINLDLPVSLLNRVTEALKNESGRSRNSFIIEAIEAHLKQNEERLIDEEFSGMVDDTSYQKSALKVGEDFAESDWEAFQKREKG